MKKIFSRAALLSALCASLTMIGCSSTDDRGSGSSKDGGKSDAGSTDGGKNSDGGSDAGTPVCAPTIVTGACRICMKGACCDAVMACQNNSDCSDCVTGQDENACALAEDLVSAYNQCATDDCAAACDTGSSCDDAADALTQGGIPEACVTCVHTSCCGELAACNADSECWDDCLMSGDDTACSSNDAAGNFFGCVQTSCSNECNDGGGGDTLPSPDYTNLVPACDAPATSTSSGTCVTIGGAFECNPVTNEGCSGGQACDYAGDSQIFVCFDPPNTEALCTACDNQAGPFCLPGNTCGNGMCARYCCDDSECGSGVCDKSFFAGSGLGVCNTP